MFPVVNTIAQVAGGADWISAITIGNPSTTAAVQGVVDFFLGNGSLMPASITFGQAFRSWCRQPDPSINTHNKGDLTAGFAKVFSNGNVTVQSRYLNPAFSPSTTYSDHGDFKIRVGACFSYRCCKYRSRLDRQFGRDVDVVAGRCERRSDRRWQPQSWT